MHSHEISGPQKQAIYKCSLTSITQQCTSARNRLAFIRIFWLPQTVIWGDLSLAMNSSQVFLVEQKRKAYIETFQCCLNCLKLDFPDQLKIRTNTKQVNMGFLVWSPEAWAIWGEVPETVDRPHPHVTQLLLLHTPGWHNEHLPPMKTSCYEAGKAWKRFRNHSCK